MSSISRSRRRVDGPEYNERDLPLFLCIVSLHRDRHTLVSATTFAGPTANKQLIGVVKQQHSVGNAPMTTIEQGCDFAKTSPNRPSGPAGRSPAVTDGPPVSGSKVDSVSQPRLALRPEAPVPAHLDGAWWPRSRHLATELPGLVAKLSYRLGQVNLVGYHLDAWTQTPPEIEIAGQAVQLVGVTSDEPNSIVLVAKDRHIALLLIPPDTGEQVAEQQLKDTSKRGESGLNEAMVNELAADLARHEGSNEPGRLDQIRGWCEEAAERFVDAPVQGFVPILIENIVRSRIDLHRTAATS